MLATSREPLTVQSEQQWPIEPLPVAPATESSVERLSQVPAIELFVERACGSDPEFVLDVSTAAPVAEICRRLDGMPLAIELAAARVRTAGVTEIASRLDERFRLLRGGRRGGDPRHQTLHDAVRWSYDLLDTQEQRLFCELSIFAGQFVLADAAQVCGGRDELDALDLITALADRSMLSVRRVQPSGQHYELLETLAAYGRSQLGQAEREELSAEHAKHYARVAKEVALAQGGGGEAAALQRAECAFPNLRSAQAFSLGAQDPDTALELICAARESAMRAMRYEVFDWAEEAAAFAGLDGHDLFPTLTGMRAYRAWLRGEFNVALELAAAVEAEEIRRGNDSCGLAQRVQANVLFAQGEVDAGLDATVRQYDLAELAQDSSRIVHAAYMRSVANSSVSNHEQANELASKALALAERTGSGTDLASGWVAKGFAAHGDLNAALEAFAESDRYARSVGNRWMSTFARTEASGALLRKGDVQAACEGPRASG